MKNTLKELSEYFNLPSNTIERWIRQGKIPIHKKGRYYFSNQSALKKWAETHNLSFSMSAEITPQTELPVSESLLSAMKLGGIHYNIKGNGAHDILKSAVDHIPYLEKENKIHLLNGLLEREQLTSTGIGKGVAIPHPRTPLSNVIQQSAITTCFLDEPTDFNSVDDRPVFILFLLVSASIKQHLYLLSRLSYCVRDNEFIDFLKTTPKPDALLARITDFEIHLDKAEMT